MPSQCEDAKPEEVLTKEECLVSFRLGSYRYFFDSKPIGPSEWVMKDGKKIVALKIALPVLMERVERRAYERVDIPTEKRIRATIWAGKVQKPIWSGSVVNMSSGGLQMRTVKTALNFFEPGDVVNVAISFKPELEPVTVEGHFRHGTLDGNMCLAGLELASHNLSPQGQEALEVISQQLVMLAQEPA